MKIKIIHTKTLSMETIVEIPEGFSAEEIIDSMRDDMAASNLIKDSYYISDYVEVEEEWDFLKVNDSEKLSQDIDHKDFKEALLEDQQS